MCLEFPKGNTDQSKTEYELKKDTEHLQVFFEAMQGKMKASVVEKGRYGWETLSIDQLEELFEGHYIKYQQRGRNKKDAVDLGCIAMMLFSKCIA